jgi:hypothetical protein
MNCRSRRWGKVLVSGYEMSGPEPVEVSRLTGSYDQSGEFGFQTKIAKLGLKIALTCDLRTTNASIGG